MKTYKIQSYTTKISSDAVDGKRYEIVTNELQEKGYRAPHISNILNKDLDKIKYYMDKSGYTLINN